MKLILQHDERDCGAACLAMLVAHYGKRLPLSRFCELTRTDRSGASLYGLASGAEQLGFAARALSGDLPGLLQELRAGTIRCPFIAHIVTEDNMLHYVVVYGLSGNRLRIADPGKGKYTLHSDTFAAGWTGHILAVEKTDAFIPGTETKGSLARFFALLKGNIRALAGVLLLSLLITAISVAGTFVFELVIDVLPGAEAEASHAEAAGGTLAALLQRAGSIHAVFMGLAVLYAAQALFHFLRSFLLSLAAKRIDLRLTLTYYNHLLGLPIHALAMRQTGEYPSGDLLRGADADPRYGSLSDGRSRPVHGKRKALLVCRRDGSRVCRRRAMLPASDCKEQSGRDGKQRAHAGIFQGNRRRRRNTQGCLR